MALPDQTHWTEAEYLAFERESDTKHEFIDGQVRAMAGASRNHTLITASIFMVLGVQAQRAGCRVFSSDMRVHLPDRGNYAYPDATIVCDEPRYLDDTFDTLTNPTIVIKVLSPGAEHLDRGTKAASYRQIASVQDRSICSALWIKRK